MRAPGLSARQLALLAVGRKALGLEETEYRALLRRAAGVSSARQLDQAGLDLVVAELERLGWRRSRKPLTRREGMANPETIARLRHLWREWTGGAGTDASLARWLERQGYCSHLAWLTAENGRLAVAALQAMVARRSAEHPPPAAA
jgi:hypothetical protein